MSVERLIGRKLIEMERRCNVYPKGIRIIGNGWTREDVTVSEILRKHPALCSLKVASAKDDYGTLIVEVE